MKKEHSNGLSRNLVGAIVLVLGIAAAFALFYSSNVRRITRQNENYIADIAFQRADLIEDLFRESLAYIDSAAIVLETEFENQEIDAAKLNVPDESDIDATELAQVADILRIYEERFAFDYLRFIDLYGRDYTTGEKVIAANVSEREYFRKGMQGQSGMTYILDSKVTSERQIGFYSPVRQNGEIAGLVVGFYGEAFIGKLLSVSLFDYDCDVLLCDGQYSEAEWPARAAFGHNTWAAAAAFGAACGAGLMHKERSVNPWLMPACTAGRTISAAWT